MLSVFAGVILPVFLVAAIGGIVGRRFRFELTTFTQAVFWLFSPALVFHNIRLIELGDVRLGAVIVVVVIVFAANVVVAQFTARARREDAGGIAHASLAGAFANQGNLGLPMSQLAFGSQGLAVGTLIWVTNLTVGSSVGIAVASLGRVRLRSAALAPFRYPALYAAGLGIAVNAVDLHLPAVIASTTDTLAGAAIPCMLVVLGLQLHVPDRGDWEDPALVTVNRLLVGPLVAWGAVAALGLTDVPAKVSIMMAGMPTAVIVSIWAAQLDARPRAAVRSIVVSTVCSMATLTVLITMLR